ncbi:hydroxyacylglutathione hydrolase [Candidatus Endobugula sertula]|uniref:Hydroxyacylglutathione hydrolase n=1 Tax=Candidatus Endobugula sertula TaxID=62101 RepID=A0A1D2QLG4_9GAMM|nr:hydroxyacylglutathione hydrolase [Candidatus Endobugula sertula]
MLTVTPIPAFSNNYLWLITHSTSSCSYIVDPGDGQAVYETLKKRNLQLSGILITHRHYDHINGIDDLLKYYQQENSIIVYGPDSPYIPQITHKLYQGDQITLFDHYLFTIFETPGHTSEHICYFSKDTLKMPVLFCGDTLFSAGCGRVMDKDPEALYRSLSVLAELPDNTQVYCAHEYTLNNLHFAQAVEPKNTHIRQRIQEVQQLRQQGIPSLPSCIAIEKQTNPFMRTTQQSIYQSVADYWGTQYANACELFVDLRRWKDEF